MLIDLVNLRPALRDDHGGMIRFHQFQKMFCELLLLIRKGAGDDGILLVQPVKGLRQLPGLRFARPRAGIVPAISVPPEFSPRRDFDGECWSVRHIPDPNIFRWPAVRRCFDGPMLVRVAGENDPALDFP